MASSQIIKVIDNQTSNISLLKNVNIKYTNTYFLFRYDIYQFNINHLQTQQYYKFTRNCIFMLWSLLWKHTSIDQLLGSVRFRELPDIKCHTCFLLCIMISLILFQLFHVLCRPSISISHTELSNFYWICKHFLRSLYL